MHKRKYLVGATLGVLGALVFSGTAMAGVPTGQTLQATIAPKKLDKKQFRAASLHNIIATQVQRFQHVSGREGDEVHAGQAAQVRQRQPACVSDLDPQCIDHHDRGSDRLWRKHRGLRAPNEVNNKTGLFPNPNPVLLVAVARRLCTSGPASTAC